MFWKRFEQLCKNDNLKPYTVVKKLGLSNSITTKWKNGAIPNGEILIKIADYFNVSVDYLLGRTEIKEVNKENQNKD